MMRRHELDPISLAFGFAFGGLGLLFLIGQADQALRLRWVWPLLLLVLGSAILLDVARGRDRPAPEVDPVPEVDRAPEVDPIPEPTSTSPEPDPALGDPGSERR
jgi:hypothetical protein